MEEHSEYCGNCEHCGVKWNDDLEEFYSFCNLKLECIEIDDWCENWQIDYDFE